MSDPFAPSSDPDIPTPTREDLINHVHGSERGPLLAGSLPASVAGTLWADARRKWDEGHKRDAERRRAEQEAKQEIGTPLAGGKTEDLPDSEFSGTFGDIKPLNGTTKGTRVPGSPDPKVPTEEPPNTDSSKAGGTKGVRVFGSRSGSAWTPESERQTKLRAFLDEQGLRAAYDAADDEQKQIIWAATERAFEDAESRKEQRRKRALEHRGRIFDALARLREDPTKKDLLPPDNASMEELEKWYEDTFTKPIPEKGVPGARPSPKALRPQGDPRNVGSSREPEMRQRQVAVDRAGKVTGQAAEILHRKAKKPDAQAQPVAAKTEEPLLPELSPRWFNRFRWFRWLRTHEKARKASGGAGVVLSLWIAKQALDYEIDGAWKTAAAVFLAAWAILAFAIYVSNVWDRQRPLMSTTWIVAGMFLFGIWWAYLPVPLTQPTTTAPPVPEPTSNSTASPVAGGKEPPSEVRTPVPNEETRAPLDVAPEKLLAFFEKYNNVQAQELVNPYIGKWAEISGTVVIVDYGENDSIIVRLTTRKGGRNKFFETHAFFREQRWINRAKVLKRDEVIRVRGSIKFVFSDIIALEDCEIIE